MSRLIDADKLIEDIEVLKKQIHQITRDIDYITPTQCESVDIISRMCECIMMELNAFEKAYKNIPTAYDVDKVVEQLENKKFKAFMTLANTGDKQLDMIYENVGNCIDETKDIVRAGGIDE